MTGWMKTVFIGALTAGLSLTAVTAAADELQLDQPLSEDRLASSSGRQGIDSQLLFNNNDQHAVLEDNLLSGNVITGNNSISDHAFENMSGVATVIQNTGNQVVIQDSTMINVLINP
ncbi:hypothetical protein QQM79_09475 [Marinobacteraceae bacterium S3BR75-40.1]